MGGHAACLDVYQLNRLSRREGANLVQSLVGKPLPPELTKTILARTDGVPLFIEELTKAVLEGGLVEERPNQFALGGPLPELAIPTTLQASLVSRLDRLEGVKEVAQIGACIGREFSYELLAAVVRRSDDGVLTSLAQLINAGLIFERGKAPNSTYAFKHALVQDAAYATLLRTKRYELHARIATALERQFSDLCEAQPEVLARHYQEAGLPVKAVTYWQRAGDRASKRSANREAVVHLRKALELLDALPDKSTHAEQELQLLIALGPALMTTRSSTAPEIGQVYARARELAQNAQGTRDLFPTVWGHG